MGEAVFLKPCPEFGSVYKGHKIAHDKSFLSLACPDNYTMEFARNEGEFLHDGFLFTERDADQPHEK